MHRDIVVLYEMNVAAIVHLGRTVTSLSLETKFLHIKDISTIKKFLPAS